MQIGLSEAAVLMRKIASFGDPRLYALALVAGHLSHSAQPLVPSRVFVSGVANGKDTTDHGVISSHLRDGRGRSSGMTDRGYGRLWRAVAGCAGSCPEFY